MDDGCFMIMLGKTEHGRGGCRVKMCIMIIELNNGAVHKLTRG